MLRRFFTTIEALVKGVVNLLFRKDEPQRALRPGELAPPFSLMGSDGRMHRLADYVQYGADVAHAGGPESAEPQDLLNAGRPAVVLAWFPKAFTAG